MPTTEGYNGAYTGPQIDEAIGAVRQKESAWDGKQDKLTGARGQVVGFNESGAAVAQDPAGGGGASAVTFTDSQWSNGTLTIPAASHGMTSAVFGYDLRHMVYGELVRNTWAALETKVSYDSTTGNILLSCGAAYSGQIIFLG